MRLTLNRCWLTTKSTVGKLLIDDVFFSYTLEDRYRPPPEPKVARETCIPVGTYEVVINHSPRFGVEMPLLLNVPGFQGVRIHAGNTSADTEGCILVGRDRMPDGVKNSRDAYAELFTKLQKARNDGERVSITIAVTPHEATP